MKICVRRHSMSRAPRALMVTLVLAGLISTPVIGPANALESPPVLTMPPVFSPLQFVQCKVDAGGGRHFIMLLLGAGVPEGFGKTVAHLLDCGPFDDPGPIAPEAQPRPPVLTKPPIFAELQFVQCKVDAGDGRHFIVLLPGVGETEGWAKTVAHLLDCGPFGEQ